MPKEIAVAWKNFKTELRAIRAEEDAKSASSDGDYITAKKSYTQAATSYSELNDEEGVERNVRQASHTNSLFRAQGYSTTVAPPYRGGGGGCRRNCCF